jgi:prolyl oligopeptidase
VPVLLRLPLFAGIWAADPTRSGGMLFNLWKDASHPRSLWRTCTPESFRSESPTWGIPLDLDALAAREGEDWTLSGASTLPRCA